MPLSNPHIEIQIEVNGLTRCDSEWLRRCANAASRTALNVQDVVAWRQFNTIISISVSSYTLDFLFPILAQDDERVFSVDFSGGGRWRAVCKINFPRRNDLQASL